jgi:hypothetical protein
MLVRVTLVILEVQEVNKMENLEQSLALLMMWSIDLAKDEEKGGSSSRILGLKLKACSARAVLLRMAA